MASAGDQEVGNELTTTSGTSKTPHMIRLRGPWNYEPLARAFLQPDGSVAESCDALPSPGRVQLPAGWDETLGTGFHGRVLCRRDFGRPTGLTSTDQIHLCVERVNEPRNVTLNGALLEDCDPDNDVGRYNVTSLLDDRNAIAIELTFLGVCPSSKLIGEVSLEIHSMSDS